MNRRPFLQSANIDVALLVHLPVAEKLRTLDALRERELTLRAASALHDKTSKSNGHESR